MSPSFTETIEAASEAEGPHVVLTLFSGAVAAEPVALTPVAAIQADVGVAAALDVVQAASGAARSLLAVTREATLPPVAAAASAARAQARGVAGAAVMGLLRTAALEASASLGGLDVDGSAVRVLAGASDHALGCFGLAQNAGACFAPHLLPLAAGPRALPRVRLTGATATITGGLGALGEIVANWLINAGAAGIVLVGRSGRADAGGGSGGGIGPLLLRSAAAVTAVRCDAAAYSEARALAALPALIGIGSAQGMGLIVHAGGILADTRIVNQTAHRVRSVAAPKAAALRRLLGEGWASASPPLMLCSSVVALLGNFGQGKS